MEAFFKQLKSEIKGDVFCDPLTCAIYSVDASIYEVKPLGIALPKDKEDLLSILKISYEHKIPVIARGAGTGITGSCLGQGLIIDTSKYFNKILEINIDKEYAVCEPGVVQDRLNEALSYFGYRLGPETSTGNRATLGGMMANNSAGAHSLLYGCMVDHVEEADLALAGGEIFTFRTISEDVWSKKRQSAGPEGHIYREVFRILDTYRSAIQDVFPKIPRNVSGYNLNKLLAAPPLNLCQVLTGSEGTLGIAAKIKVKITKKPQCTGICIVHVAEMIPAMRFINAMLAYRPIALEMIDDKILDSARLSPAVKDQLGWLIGKPQAVFIAEFQGATQEKLDSLLNEFADSMQSIKLGYARTILKDPQEIAAVWHVRKAGLGLLLSKREYSRAIAFIEDISIPPHQLSEFMQEFCAYLKSIGKEAGIYGHIGSGCMHIRPYIDLRKKEELEKMRDVFEHVSQLVLAHGGAMSGEHGDGLIRSWLNEKMYGPEVYQAFKELKTAFDPHGLMNPGKIVNGTPFTENLRLSPESLEIKIPTFLDFSQEGGIELAADLCNGNGECRKKESVMCPSFQASDEEYHSTRARAQSLRAIIHGKLPLEKLTSRDLYGVLDLCIECKACKKECPSQVDMAKMKSEILYQYQERHGYSLRSRLFANINRMNRMAFSFAKVFNWFASTGICKKMQSFFGIAPERNLPVFAAEPFSSWFNKQKQTAKAKKVVLFSDTYTEFNEPEIGKAAFQILSALDYEILLAEGFCCGRPFLSKGFLKEAKNHAARLVHYLSGLAKEEIDVVILEPSCFSAIIDDYQGLLGNDVAWQKIKNNTVSFEEFLHRHLQKGKLPLNFSGHKRDVWVHGHCHQKALAGTAFILDVLRGVEGFSVHEIDSGCCGMAGSFGYEKEHYQFSMKIGELKLLPKIREIPIEDGIIACGMSCRSQIHDGTKRRAVHLSEAIACQLTALFRTCSKSSIG